LSIVTLLCPTGLFQMLNYLCLMETSFIDWLNLELQRRDWTQADLSQKSGITQGAISKVINGQRKPGVDFCDGIAHAFKYPSDRVMRAAGLLPQIKTKGPTLEEINHKLTFLPPDKQQMILDLIDSLIDKEDREARVALNGKGAPQH
jgi:transcriptional regulator with XRE-family HTH domain